MNEQRAATASPEYAITYEGYAKAVILRRANLAASITETDGKIEVARDEVQEAYREMRKYEIAEERAQKRAASEEARLEQAEMEEIASTQFRLRQREKTEFLLLPSPPSLAGEHLRWADGGGWHSFKDWLGLVPYLAGRGAPAVGGLWGVAQLQGLARPGPLPRLRGRVREVVGPKRGAWISRWQKKIQTQGPKPDPTGRPWLAVDPRITRPHSPLPPQESVAVGASPLVENGAQRKLATILAADVVEYSRLTAAGEEGTHARFKASLAEVIEPAIAKYQGRVIKNTGDGFLAEFASAVSCVACAVEIQRRLGRRNQDVVADRRMEFRFGINIGDVIADGGDVYGGGVNVAVRLEGMCDPGGILVSEDAYRQVHDKLEIEFQDRGPQNLKNIDTPVRAYAVEMGSVAGTAPVTSGAQHPQRMGLAIAAVVIAAVIGAIAWQATQPPTVEAAMVENMAFPLPDKPSIAVLPFVDLSVDRNSETLAEGMSEDILTALSKLDELFVISRTTSSTYKGKDVTVKQVAEDLGVRYVLEGSVQRSGDTMRVTAQLIDALSGQHIWADRYDRDVTALFAVKDEITLNIVSNISAETGFGAMDLVSRRDTNAGFSGVRLRSQTYR